MKGKKVLVCPTMHNLAVSPVSFKNIQICPQQYGIFACHMVKNILYKNIYVPSKQKYIYIQKKQLYHHYQAAQIWQSLAV